MDTRIRYWRRIWLISLVCVAVLFILFLRMPVDGSAGDLQSLENGSGFTIRWLLDERDSGPFVEDEILLMDGQSPQELASNAQLSSMPQNTQVVTYRVLRDNEEIDLQVSLRPLNLQSLIFRRYPNLFLFLVFFILPSVFLWKLSHSKIGIFTTAFCISVGFLTLLDVFNLQPALFFNRWFFWLEFFIELAARCVAFGVILHFALIFPQPVPLFEQKPRWLIIIYAIMPLAVVITMFLSPSLGQGLMAAGQVMQVVALVEMLLAVGVMLWHQKHLKDILNRLRMYWLWWSMLVGLGLYLLVSVLSFELHQHGLYPVQVLWGTLFFLPFVIASLVSQEKLLLIDEFANRMIVYGSLLVVLGAFYVLVVRLFTLFFPHTSVYTNLFSLVAALLTAFLAFWLKPQAQSMVDRLFFRSKLSMQRVLPWIERQIAHTLDIEKLASWLIKELPYHFQISNAALLVLDDDEQDYVSIDGNNFYDLPLSHALPQYLRRKGTHLVRVIEEQQLESEARVYLQKNRVELSLPLMCNDNLVGILNLASKVNGKPFTHREVDLLLDFCQPAADAVCNARNYREANSYNQTLEKQVRQRTAELARAVHDSEEERYTAERAGRAKSIFLGSVSHQIRTPMNAVLGMVDLLFNTQLTDDQHEYINDIQQNSETLLKMVNDIIDYSLIESGKLELEKDAFQVSAVIESALDEMGLKAKAKGLDLSYLMEAHTPLTVLGDARRLHQILVNVLERAVWFTNEGEIVIYITSKASDEPSSQLLHFAVKDSGSIIPPGILETFFLPFQTFDAVPYSFGGTGLGLTISKLLSEAMGGEMWVETGELQGMGSTVHFTMLVEAEESTYPAYLGVEQPLLDGKKVFLIDSDMQQVKLLTLHLQSWGMHIEQASSAEEALNCMQQHEAGGGGGKVEHLYKPDRFDVILVAQRLKDMDGVAFTKEIRRTLDKKQLPVILLVPTGWRAADNRMKETARILEEPYEAEKLYNVLIEIFIDEGYHIPEEPQKTGFDEHMAEYQPLDILVVEDNPTNKKLVLLFLEGLGYQPDTADHGYQALELVQKNRYDLILMDVRMPDMDGMETTRHIRKILPADRQPKIIAMTAEAMQGDRQNCLDAGMDDYLSKPIRIWELISMLTKYRKGDAGAADRRAASQFELSNLQQTVPLSQMPSLNIEKQEAAHLDETVLAQLRQSFGRRADSVMPKLVRDFVKEAQKLIVDIRYALGKNEPEAVLRYAHTLKANGAAMGAMLLSERSNMLEEQARNKNLDKASATLSLVEEEFETVRLAYLKAGYIEEPRES